MKSQKNTNLNARADFLLEFFFATSWAVGRHTAQFFRRTLATLCIVEKTNKVNILR